MLFRAFPLLPGSAATAPGGPLHVARPHQGQGRHDNPALYGALYLSRSPEAAVAEFLRDFQRSVVDERDLQHEGNPRVLATIDDTALNEVLDLDDPRNLVARNLRPSGVATRHRRRTQPMARAIYREGVAGFEWWSTIEGSWINVTLFADRAVEELAVLGDPEPLTLDHPAVRGAAQAVGVLLATA